MNPGGLLYLAKMGMGLMTWLYVGGPYAAVHSGGTPFLQGDYSFSEVTNSRGAGGTLDTWQVAFARLFDPLMTANNLMLPSSAVPTVSDSLIT